MNTNRKDVIEPEIIDETGQNISPVQPAKDHARPKGIRGGLSVDFLCSRLALS